MNGKIPNIQSCVGAMKIARQPRILASTRLNGASPIPAPSLRELARPTGVTEGVSSVGCSMPMVYTPAHMNSEIFERLRSPKYTPSVSHSLDSSLREGAGIWCVPFNVPPKNRNVAGDFHRPYETQRTLHCTIIQPPRKLRNFLPFAGRRGRPGRNSGRTGGWRRSGSGDTRRTGLWWRPRRASGGRWAWRR